MARVPCCEKMGLKKGPWTPEEDQILTSYVQQHGHQNWRALPKLAGLLRCGKSCRLRWTNYLRPDIKRGNFSKEEEDTIIKLHQIMGNRWSAIANKLPGRTDNEIKNYWHTHLKKRVQQNQAAAQKMLRCSGLQRVTESSSSAANPKGLDYCIYAPCRPEITTLKKTANDSSSSTAGTITALGSRLHHDYQFTSTAESRDDITTKDDMVFWYNIFVNAEKS